MGLEDSVNETATEVVETPVEVEVPPNDAGGGAPAAATDGLVADEVKPEPTLEEKLAGLKEKADAKKAAAKPAETTPGETPALAAEAKNADGTPKWKPNYEIEVIDAEAKRAKVQIPDSLKKFMTTPESEKEIRELFSKAKGLDFVKSKNAEVVQANAQITQENTAIKHSIDELRGIYRGAVQTGNWHRLDSFFEKLQIPVMHVLQYAMEKAKLSEMPPEQRSLVEQQIDADRRAETIASQQSSTQAQNLQMSQQMKQLQIEMTLARPEVVAIRTEFETRNGKPGSFEGTMRKYGELAWHQSAGRINLTPIQVIEQMAADGLFSVAAATPAAATQQPAATPAAAVAGVPAQSAVPGKPILQRTPQTIPNVQGKGGASPLKAKPRSIEDLKKLHQDMVDAEKGA